MAKFVSKIKDFIAGPYIDEGDEYEDEYEDMEYPVSRDKDVMDYSSPSRTSRRSSAGGSQVLSIHTNAQMQVVIIKPESYEDAQEICDQLKNKKPVVVNLEKVEYPIAQRIMDFLSGTCYSLEGNIQRVANNIFVIAPENVEVTGDFKEELKTKGIIKSWASPGK